MRMQPNARTIEVSKEELIKTIKENKDRHIIEYDEAVKAYREEAKKQLNEQKRALAKGNLHIRVNLVTPINKSDEYDKLVKMFEWEINKTVILSQGEFNEYVLDETDFAVAARASNSMYSNTKFK